MATLFAQFVAGYTGRSTDHRGRHHHDPYDVSWIWVRGHHGDGGWVPAIWKHLKRVPVPFGDLAWDHVAQQLPEATEEELADAVSALLTRAHAGPPGEPGPQASRRERRVAPAPRTPAPPSRPPSPPNRTNQRTSRTGSPWPK
ncbi:hypothetical protein [Streptomyces sp. NPDC093099]|uniref:hypothetical protein n=1 Tax=Streptomyces sp. NPDC093099 TaxID=3366028 RepID=UPI00380900D4